MLQEDINAIIRVKPTLSTGTNDSDIRLLIKETFRHQNAPKCLERIATTLMFNVTSRDFVGCLHSLSGGFKIRASKKRPPLNTSPRPYHANLHFISDLILRICLAANFDMMFHDSILVLLSGLLYQAGAALSADPPLPPWYPLKPWEITSLRAQSPRNGTYGTNATLLEITISNPSLIPAGPAPHASGGGYVVFDNSTANCAVHWKVDSRTPYGNTKDTCPSVQSSSTQARWNITINEIRDEPAHYIDLSFSLAYSMQLFGTDMYKLLAGHIHTVVGENLEGGCDENDLCTYTLKDGLAPLLVQPTLQECKNACG
ncbi:hypothetical protein M426DRAFT_257016 [Hypoxylon sp. CI-4A]|nr:hypothetical protein M426DRAFT_257016 [Hypoxylon sp. CI-4A]